MLLALALVIGEIQFISLGLIGEMLSQTYYESLLRYSGLQIRDAKTLANCEINNIAASVLLQLLAMFRFISMCLGVVVCFFRTRRSLLLENLALRQQLVVLIKMNQQRVPLWEIRIARAGAITRPRQLSSQGIGRASW